MLYAIADLHLSLGCDKPMDIFVGWNDYVSRLEKAWRRLITPDDTVVIAGDISWAMKLEETYNDFKFINSLPGEKIILKGNHDYWWGTKTKIEEFLQKNNFNTIKVLFNNSYTVDGVSISGSRGWFYDIKDADNKKVLNREAARLNTSILAAENKPPVVFLHYPPVFGDYICDEVLNVLRKNNITQCYYGHLHGRAAHAKAIQGIYEGIKFKMVSADGVDFTPVLVR